MSPLLSFPCGRTGSIERSSPHTFFASPTHIYTSAPVPARTFNPLRELHGQIYFFFFVV